VDQRQRGRQEIRFDDETAVFVGNRREMASGQGTLTPGKGFPVSA